MALPTSDAAPADSSSTFSPLSSRSAGADVLAAEFAEEMGVAWRKGERPLAEEFLNRHPPLWEQPEIAAQLIYEEICLRQEANEQQAEEAVIRRFPQWDLQLRAMLDFHRLLRPGPAIPDFPEVGESLGDFQLLATLGQGAVGRVYLAMQHSLADRPVVLKTTRCDGGEHLSLARLQHTYIIPLYAAFDLPERNLRVLCMPFVGGTTLAALLESMKGKRPQDRAGKDFVDALDRIPMDCRAVLPCKGPARQFLARASYVRALCWIGACLAEALHYAHDRDLIHLDLKASNVLLASDGQPMLLDFHLARSPLAAGAPVPAWLGGTYGLMSPEQRTAMQAVREGKPVPRAIDGRSDVYSLGVLLYESLAGQPLEGQPPAPLRRLNPKVTVGLADVVHKCLAADPRDRYASAAALAIDLRQHLADRPLLGVANRSLRERWRKWRRRRPQALAVATLLLLLVGGLLAAGAYLLTQERQRTHEAEAALHEGNQLLEHREYTQAALRFKQGLVLVEHLPGNDELRQALTEQVRRSERGQQADVLHRLADRMRFLYGLDLPASPELRALEASCRTCWEQQARNRAWEDLGPDAAERYQTDLLDLAILWADLRVRLTPRGESRKVGAEVSKLLDEAEARFGPSPVLTRERQVLAQRLGLPAPAGPRDAVQAPRTAWEHYALGRIELRAGNFQEAAVCFDLALRLRPRDLWPNFSKGVCAYHLKRYEDALAAFSTCLAVAPEAELARCVYNRGLAYAALGHTEQAFQDYSQALAADPKLAAAALNRGLLYGQKKQFTEAVTDLTQALACGADPAVVHYNLALIHQEQRNRPAALLSVQQALAHDPNHPEARRLLNLLKQNP